MSDELRPTTSNLLKSYQELKRLRSSAIQPYELTVSQVMRLMEPVWRQQSLTCLSSQFTNRNAGVASLLTANDHWQTMIKRPIAPSQGLIDLSRIHASWMKGIQSPMRDHFAQLHTAAQLTIGTVACQLAVTERIFAGLDFWSVKRMVELTKPSQVLYDSISQMTAKYTSLAESIHSHFNFTQLPSFTVPGATRELFMTGYTLKTRFPPKDQEEETVACQEQILIDIERETAPCLSFLQSLNPALVKLYLGAREALNGSNPDRVRHVLVSLRELWSHVLRHLAPDSEVWKWIGSQEKTGQLCKGSELVYEEDGQKRLTRRARVLFICRKQNHPPLADFFDLDTKALVKLFELFNRVHELDSPLTEKQLRTIFLRTEFWFINILQLQKA
jgi:hypothetical protein